MKLLVVSFTLCVLFPFITKSQAREDEVIIRVNNRTITIEESGGTLRINEKNEVTKQFLKNFERHSKEVIHYNDFDPVVEFEAHTITPKNGKSKKTKVVNSTIGDVFQPGVFYGGYKKIAFNYPSLEPNSMGFLKYEKSIKDPHLILPFFFQDNHYPISLSRFKVVFDNNVKINFRVFGISPDSIRFEKSLSDGKTAYCWFLQDIPAYTREKNAPSRAYSSPHIVIWVESYGEVERTQKVLENCSDLYNWYRKLIGNSGIRDKEIIIQTVNEITRSKVDRLDSVKSIFNWVQKNIKYIAFEDGMAGFVPRSADDVIIKRYGDCKDMANLLVSMYQSMGVNSYLSWIGTRSRPYSYEEVPTAITDNHMICTIELDDQYLFLDATNPYAKFGSPTSTIQGKEALVGVSESDYKIMQVPLISPNVNQRIDSIYCQISDVGLLGTLKTTLTGYSKEEFQLEKLKAMIKNNEEYLRDHLFESKDNLLITGMNYTGMEDNDSVGVIDFQFEIPGYARRILDKIYLNLNLRKDLPGNKVIVEERKSPIEEDFKYMFSSIVKFEIPQGYTASFVPDNSRFEWKYGTVVTEYELEDNCIVYSKEYISDFLYLNHDEWSEWNNAIDQLTKINKESLILEKI